MQQRVDCAGLSDVAPEISRDVTGVATHSADQVVDVGDANRLVVSYPVTCLTHVVEAEVDFVSLRTGRVEGFQVRVPEQRRVPRAGQQDPEPEGQLGKNFSGRAGWAAGLGARGGQVGVVRASLPGTAGNSAVNEAGSVQWASPCWTALMSARS